MSSHHILAELLETFSSRAIDFMLHPFSRKFLASRRSANLAIVNILYHMVGSVPVDKVANSLKKAIMTVHLSRGVVTVTRKAQHGLAQQ